MMGMKENNNYQKFAASLVVIFAVVLIAYVTSAVTKKEETTAANSSDATSSQTDTTMMGPQASTNMSNMMSGYKDGTYSDSDTYPSPGGIEDIAVTITIKDGVITAATIQQQANNRDSEEYQSAFQDNFKSKVVGKALSSLSLSRVSGASLTTDGFNEALNNIRSQAQA
jgi:uncharacterized protein with FMN-binding domain